ncbi:MAG: aldehyde ferredoxin oxidoreductase family protein [Rhodospirillaceae bacterium]|jgi:aldehyde:ferredoxin oxidoreductase|nr:aldehyde ferredoxin oxidoreductase family protein [Rhodospirillaceae bacterium]MBT4219066.1 aldehyde ferredoxin oxidoreductase family protein [Rhodospirillaceae bacterium]MBT4464244.1 aldehyde ferredoxin oxidoreductase family protein [Rhodospirillaceae bacterium]MBT5013788.1 aldehyde ferredoxin oxidoreductase family protein [Rhodospirillaceae bacterium]MBT5308991.1 aldehyde ferredoxin oxidoreductase family protein [Rhodospirillaceae bacterium]
MALTNKVLRVNLSNGTCESEATNAEWAKKYLGQRGLATKYMVEEVDPKVDALSADNKLIFATGPLTGTAAPTSGRWSVITKSPLTGAIACSNSGGFFGAEMKNAGWDMIIFEGKSDGPVYLDITNDQAELKDASNMWGKTVWETEDMLREIRGDNDIRCASIGPAGESGVLFAAVVNDKDRAAGRSGVGTVMGSKNLKAIAVRGTVGTQVGDAMKFMQAAGAAKQILADNAVTGEGLPTYGTQVLMNVINETGALPTRNANDVQFEGASKIGGEAMHEIRESDGQANLVSNNACFGCPISCARISKIDPEHFTVKGRPEYQINSGGLEYESAWSLGAATGVDDLEALTYCNFICNELGMDPISLGSTIAAAMDLYKEGAITDEDTGGMKLEFGNTKALVAIVEATGRGEGFGVEIGQGSRRMCEKYGRPELSMTVKSQEFPAYDPRGIQGMGLTYATSNRGACHLRSYTVASEVLGIPEKTDPLTPDGKAGLVKAFQDATAVVDSSGTCIFTTFALTMDDIAPMIDADLEGDWSSETLMELGERVWNLERKFNMDAGLTAADDTLPQRLLKEAAKTGPAKGKVNELDKMLPEYYELRGWTADGVPSNETLDRLKL